MIFGVGKCGLARGVSRGLRQNKRQPGRYKENGSEVVVGGGT